MPAKLLIIGASVRAAAGSASRAPRLGPIGACDLFADADLGEIATATRLENGNYPGGFLPWALAQPPALWMYTGGVENEPDLVAQISRRHTLAGNPPHVLRPVRNPADWPVRLASQGLDVAPVARREQINHNHDRWLVKPIGSCGGLGIRRLSAATVIEDADEYCQRFVEGASRAGLFLADGQQARLLGVMASWTLADCVQASPSSTRVAGPSTLPPGVWRKKRFVYAGSIGPLELSSRQRKNWERIGQVIRREFGLCGLFGVDAIETATGRTTTPSTITIVEINPRFTASMELLDYVGGCPVVEQHIAACLGESLADSHATHGPHPSVAGKAVLYAPRDICWTERLQRALEAHAAADGAWLADLPTEGTTIRGGEPVTTILSVGRAPAELARRLGFAAADGLWQRLTAIFQL